MSTIKANTYLDAAGGGTAALSGNATTATTLATGRNFSLTGEVTAPAVSFNGSAVVALATTIASNAVDSSNILALSVSSGKIQSGAITTAKFATGAADSAALGSLSVSNAKIQASTITSSKFSSVTSLIIYNSVGAVLKTIYSPGT